MGICDKKNDNFFLLLDDDNFGITHVANCTCTLFVISLYCFEKRPISRVDVRKGAMGNLLGCCNIVHHTLRKYGID